VPKILRITAFVCVALTLVSCSRDPEVRKKRYLDSGNKYFDRGNYKAASLMYRNALHVDQKYGEAYYKLAMTALKQNQAANAVGPLRRAVELLPKGTKESDEANLDLAEILLFASQSTEVEARSKPLVDEVKLITKGFLDRNPNSFEGHKLTGDLFLAESSGNLRKRDLVNGKAAMEKAIAEYRKSLELRPGDGTVSLSLARSLAIYGETGEAEQLYRAAIDKNPKTGFTCRPESCLRRKGS
jgi:tetratricopeptide (TPR) repeat protein